MYSTWFNPQTNHQTTGVACHCSYEIAFAKILCQHLGRGTSVKKFEGPIWIKFVVRWKSAENLQTIFHLPRFWRHLKFSTDLFKGRRVMVKSSICIPFFKRRPSLSWTQDVADVGPSGKMAGKSQEKFLWKKIERHGSSSNCSKWMMFHDVAGWSTWCYCILPTSKN